MNSIIQMDTESHQSLSSFGFFDIYHKNSFKQEPRTTGSMVGKLSIWRLLMHELFTIPRL